MNNMVEVQRMYEYVTKITKAKECKYKLTSYTTYDEFYKIGIDNIYYKPIFNPYYNKYWVVRRLMNFIFNKLGAEKLIPSKIYGCICATTTDKNYKALIGQGGMLSCVYCYINSKDFTKALSKLHEGIDIHYKKYRKERKLKNV